VKFWEIEGKDSNGKPLLWWAVEGAFNGKYKVIAEFDGTFGKIFTLESGSASGHLVAKTPNIIQDEPIETIRGKVRQFLHELNQTFRYSHHPLISRHVGLAIAFGLPVVLSRKRDFTLHDLIEAGPIKPLQAAQIIAQLAHVLAYCSAKGLTAHQDLKAENVLVDRLADQLATPEGSRYPLDHRALVCDFGLANAFSAFGKRAGSRPYMAPEQFSGAESLAKVDIFALGVILHELLTGGLHPIGEITRDVWPHALPTKTFGKIGRANQRPLILCVLAVPNSPK
jgi:serine/threonine protein kinase